ncbi:MAG TPA: Mpo1-like protein [Usitatibacter sp.]
MKSIEENLTQYAAYHRDRRNIATHFAGVPMIVFAVVLALANAILVVNGFAITAAAIVSIAACVYHLRQDLAFGLAMAVVLFAMCAAASEITARTSPAGALGLALLVFTAGWALQFLGHKYEGMKPAFFDDVMQLAIGPLFVCAEAFFLLGARADLRRCVEDRVGPAVARRDGAAIRADSPAAR